MVKIPIGSIVKVDLWDTKKKHGMVKYFTNTMNLVRAESEYFLKKNDLAIVTHSLEGFCLIIPKDEYYNIIKDNKHQAINIKRLTQKIFKILKEKVEENGGILTIDDLYFIFQKTPIKNYISKKIILKAVKDKENPFVYVRDNGIEYIMLKLIDCPNDEIIILSLARSHSYLTLNFIQRETNWTNIRIKRVLNFMLQTDRCRKDSSYLTGERYFFNNI